jgi:hypothetical protein
VVITETISTPGAMAIVTSVLTGPRMIRRILPASTLRALTFIASLLASCTAVAGEDNVTRDPKVRAAAEWPTRKTKPHL